MAEVIVALDQPTPDAALALADRLPDLGWVKVGPTLFVRGGPAVLTSLRQRGLRVFLDLKWHDIPHQVAGAVRAAASMGIDLVTVHALGGPDMLAAAVEAAGERLRVAAVTVLTSHTSAAFGRVVGREAPPLHDEVRRLAVLAVEAGIHAIVASPEEIGPVRRVMGADRWIVVPGIRLPGAEPDDQRRTATPAAAARAGATHLVVGRPVTGADDPARVYQEICKGAS